MAVAATGVNGSNGVVPRPKERKYSVVPATSTKVVSLGWTSVEQDVMPASEAKKPAGNVVAIVKRGAEYPDSPWTRDEVKKDEGEGTTGVP